ncbi:MAG: substrate-binding domain-containing protein [Mycoplasmatales bacterium]
MKKIIAVLVVTILVLAGCGTATDGDTQKVGVAMPTKSAQRWIQDGDNLKSQLEEKGYEVDLQYAQDDTSVQASQIENMITQGVDCLVVASVDGTALTEPLQQAQDAGIPVISYDRLLMNTDAVSYYITFDNYQVGALQAQYIIDTLGLDLNDTSKTYNMEIFAGSLSDNNATFFYNGAMDTIHPYIDAVFINVA